jgi:CheY-like chemotaxis protein/DNA-directed RNA polymerase specialized sigma24 family protein
MRRDDLVKALPYARRYARALLGNQAEGDRLVADGLRLLLDRDAEEGIHDARQALYEAVTRRHLSHACHERQEVLTATQLVLLLLTALEELPVEAAARIAGLSQEDAARRLAEGRDRLRSAAAADVLIIEDEPIIAMDIEELVQNCGHNVVGVAASEAEAVRLARQCRPGLILADINLGLGGDGAAAVARIVQDHDVPVIFVTAYPERLLTGEAVEPAFVITKPFEPATLAIATYQAVTGGVTLA